MADESKRFCEKCGAKMGPNDPVCPECGKVYSIPGQINANQSSAPHGNVVVIRKEVLDSVTRFMLMLLGVYAAVSVVEGLFYTMTGEATVDLISAAYTSEQWTEYLKTMGLSSKEGYVNALFISGVISLVGGIATGISFFLCYRREHWIVALTLCLYASFLVLLKGMAYTMDGLDIILLVLQCIVGLFVSRMIYSVRFAFRS